jgi:hypothetical protein
MARGAGARVIALLLMGLLAVPQTLSLVRVWASAAGCACTEHACCRPSGPKAMSMPCHSRAGDAVPDTVMRCHHPSVEAMLPALPGLVSPRVSAVVDPDESLLPTAPPGAPRLGFNRIESPPPRSFGNA